ncbi:MAG TPA: hypothetical protein VGB14_03035 [Acidimicrobiales bacterium]
MTRRHRLAVVLLAATVLLAACGGDDDDGGSGDEAASSSTSGTEATTGSTEAETTTSEATTETTGATGEGASLDEYANGVCTAMSTWQSDLQGLAGDLQANPPTDPSTGKDVLIDFVADMASVTDQMVQSVTDAGPPAVDAGDEIHGTLVNGLNALSALFDQLQTDIAAVPEDDPTAFTQALTEVTTQFQASAEKTSEAFSQVDEQYPEQSQQLQAAFQAEPACAGVIG